MTSPAPPGAPPPAGRVRWVVRPRATLTGHRGDVVEVAWGQLGEQPVLATAGRDRRVRLWDPAQGTELRALTDHTEDVLAVAWGQLGDQPVLASGSRDRTVRLWDPAQGTELRALTSQGGVLAVAWGQLGDQPVLASGGGDGTVRLWDPAQGTELRTLTGGTDLVLAVAWGQLGDQPVLASGGGDGTVRLWDPAQGTELRTLTGHTAMVRAVAWGQLGDQPVLATGGEDGTVRLWDPAQGTELRTLTGDTGWVMAVAWGQLGDQPVLATGGGAGTVRLWDPATGTELRTLTGHTGFVLAVAWGQLGDRPVLATGGGDGTVRLWDLLVEQFTDRLPGYSADDLADPDRLGRDTEAAALAEMITARSARPPLAIGLFGDWGEGKSHFLGRIDAHVRELAAIARRYPEDRLTHAGVRQVWFNAWHYAETDLWASLVAELFGQLATSAEPGVSQADEQRRQSRLAAEVIARRGLQERLAGAQARLDELRAHSRPPDSLDGLPGDLRGDVRLLAGGKPEQFYRSLTGAGWLIGRQAALARAVARRIRPRWWAAAAAVVAATVLVAVYAAPFAAPAVRWLLGLGAAIGVLVTLARPVQDAWKKVTEVRGRVDTWVASQQARLELAVNLAAQEVGDLQRELQNLTAGGQLAGLVAEQAGSGAYRSRLGLMTQIRTDFQRMAQLLAEASQEPAADEAGDTLPRIDRVVVYIDDLDRCPPDRVVEVLEAVQLLLAIPLFVVVVAVDPRWLLRSLTVHYHELFNPSHHAAAGANWGSTPMQYLEKIFQIPFTLPPVSHAGYTAMVEALTAPHAGSSPSAAPPGGPVAPAGTAPAATGPAQGSLRPVPLPAAPVVERFDPLALTDDERRLLALLGPPLVTTPRSIKRLVNSYGLLNALRGARHAQDLQETTHTGTGKTYHPYRAGMTLLGILIAFPDLSPAFFPRLHEASAGPDPCNWAQFLKQASPTLTGDQWGSELASPLASEPQGRRWQQLARTLEDLTAAAAATEPTLALPEPLEAWAEWVIPVGRLSFETGQAVITSRSASRSAQ